MERKPKKLFLLLIPILSLVLGLGTSCIYIDSQTEPPPGPPPPEVTAPPNPAWTLPPVTRENPPLPDFISVVAMVNPTVVAVDTEIATFDIFNRPSTQKGAGSGWIIDKDGHIVTNNHVIQGAQSITVTLADGSSLQARIVGADALSDLAVLKVDRTNLPAAIIGDSSKLNLGEWVLAIGNALGRGMSVKEGIVSRLGVTITVGRGQNLYDLIETSAAINPGNSGGPLFNMSGEVIGITSAKLAAIGIEGLGYAISTNTAKPIIEELIQNGYIIRPWLGVELGTVTEWLVFRYDLAVDKGAFIGNIVPNSPADDAGLKPEDIIVGLNGKEITTAQDLIRAIHAAGIGGEVEITYYRGQVRETTSAILTESPPP